MGHRAPPAVTIPRSAAMMELALILTHFADTRKDVARINIVGTDVAIVRTVSPAVNIARLTRSTAATPPLVKHTSWRKYHKFNDDSNS